MNENILILAPLKFYSSEDEELFFAWLDKIPSIKSYQGIGRELHVSVSLEPITFHEYRNFNGLFKRYKFKNIEQLKMLFKTKDNTDWFD